MYYMVHKTIKYIAVNLYDYVRRVGNEGQETMQQGGRALKIILHF